MGVGQHKRAFFVSPIGRVGSEARQRSDKVLNHILKPALVPAVVDSIERADESANPGEITSTIIASILEADIVVADLTDSNPNVFYEVALAHAFGKPVIHIRYATDDPIPFDIKDLRLFDYTFDIAEAATTVSGISKAAAHALREPESVKTPVDRGRVIALNASSPDVSDQISADILERLDRIDSRLRGAIIGGPARYSSSVAESRLHRMIRAASTALAHRDADRFKEIRHDIDLAVDSLISERMQSRPRHDGDQQLEIDSSSSAERDLAFLAGLGPRVEGEDS